MGRGGTVCLSYAALVLLSTVSTTNACLWCVEIDESPAPPPDKVPPFSANAVRDISLLPYQIVGVLGAYVGTVLIIGTLLLTVGRKMRGRAQEQPAPQQEMIKPIYRQFDPSPISPASGRWNRLRGKRSEASSIRSMASVPGMSPEVAMGGFDNTVLEADRARMHSEMERLYAAVMHQDTTKGQPTETVMPMAPPEPPAYTFAGNNGDRQRGHHLQPGQTYPQSPRSPVRAIYPPTRRTLSGDTLHGALEHSRTDSFGSSRSIKSTSSRNARKSVRNLTISAPIQRRGTDDDDDLRTPLSPRIYIDPGIPPEPQTPRDPFNPPETPATERVFSLYSDEQDDYDDEEQLDEIRDLPQATPQRPAEVSRPRIITNFSKPVLSPTTPTAPPLRATGSGTLPLREMNRQYAAQQQQQQQQQSSQALHPQSANHWSNPRSPGQAGGYLTSAGPVKTTFVEARRDRLGVGGHGLRTPLTGMATPYSPYMPFTPMTPVTPHLTTRTERRQRAREDRTIMGVVTEEDAVADERELWDSGY